MDLYFQATPSGAISMFTLLDTDSLNLWVVISPLLSIVIKICLLFYSTPFIHLSMAIGCKYCNLTPIIQFRHTFIEFQVLLLPDNNSIQHYYTQLNAENSFSNNSMKPGKLFVGFYGISNYVGLPYNIIHIELNSQTILFLTFLFKMFVHNLNNNSSIWLIEKNPIKVLAEVRVHVGVIAMKRYSILSIAGAMQ